MKKLTVLLASLLVLFSSTDAIASGFLVKGGMNFPGLDLKNLKSFDVKAYTGWHAGVGYQTGSVLGFSLQPELNYVRNGVITQNAEGIQQKVFTNQIQLVPNIQWGIDLLVCKPYLYLAPYAAYNFATGSGSEAEPAAKNAKKFDYGVGAGLGLNIWKFQVTGKYNWAFGNVISWNEYFQELKDVKLSNGAFVLSVGFIF